MEVRTRIAGMRQMLSAPGGEFGSTLPGLPVEFLALLEEMAADVRPESMNTVLRLMATADQRELLPRIAVPTLLIWGELDARSPLSVARQFERAIDGAKLVMLSGAGHMSNLEQPEQFNAPCASSSAHTRRARLGPQPHCPRSPEASACSLRPDCWIGIHASTSARA